jgi:deferrochelatase/peroxidase EfeB
VAVGGRRRWPRVVVAVLGLLFALAPAAPAMAHEVGGAGATNFQTTLSALTPSVAGLTLRVIENGSRLELRNDSGTEVIVAGYGGEPYARVGPDGVYVNDNSPATYLNADRFSTATVPFSADGKGPLVWRQVATEPLWRWHDHRVHWMLKTLPPSVAADPGAPHRISAWTVVLQYGDQRLTAAGTLDWVPGPSPWPWFVLVALVAAAVAGATYLSRPHRALAIAVGLLFLADLAHGFGAMVITAGTVPQKLSALVGADALLIWPFALLTGWLLWRRHTRAAWLAAGIGALMAIEMAVDDAPVLWRSSSPSALPPTLNRAAVALVVGIGVGLVVALPLLLRRHPPADRPWPGAAKGEAAPETVPQPAVRAGTDGADRLTVGLTDGIGRRQVAGMLAAGALGALAGGTVGATLDSRAAPPAAPTGPLLGDVGARSIAFRGEHQAGIVAPLRPQAHAWIAAFDLEPGVPATALRDLLGRWSDAADRLMAGQPLGATDDAVVAGLGPSALTVTVGFGQSLFGQAGVPAAARPEALAPLPVFAGERLDPARSNGDIGVVVAADATVVALHAARILRRLAAGTAHVRWQMSGFNAARGAGPDAATGRNLMGQVDGTNNPRPTEPDFGARIFAGSGAPEWLRGGSYLVVRRIRMLLDAWDTLAPLDQERVIGRRRDSGAPLTGGHERSAADLGARAADGSLLIPSDAHMRLAAPAANEGAAMLRRGFSYVDGDESGLLFLAWQADPRRGFIPVQQRLVANDALSRFIRHETSALFAVPGGVAPGSYIGQALLEPS